ncbi:hypothetical protein GWI33_018055 [Rhynchophorus ferrugineus]|nr:hypothetical protein GWI33_018055 [Rhynchophorus ferrugineus]
MCSQPRPPLTRKQVVRGSVHFFAVPTGARRRFLSLSQVGTKHALTSQYLGKVVVHRHLPSHPSQASNKLTCPSCVIIPALLLLSQELPPSPSSRIFPVFKIYHSPQPPAV